MTGHAGFTGTQKGMSDPQKRGIEDLVIQHASRWLHHGDCMGADAEAHAIAVALYCRPIVHPPTDPTKRAFCPAPPDCLREPKPYIARNHDIVDSSSVLFAAPFKDEASQPRSGTWATIRYALRRIPVYIVWRDGTIERRDPLDNPDLSC